MLSHAYRTRRGPQNRSHALSRHFQHETHVQNLTVTLRQCGQLPSNLVVQFGTQRRRFGVVGIAIRRSGIVIGPAVPMRPPLRIAHLVDCDAVDERQQESATAAADARHQGQTHVVRNVLARDVRVQARSDPARTVLTDEWIRDAHHLADRVFVAGPGTWGQTLQR